MRIVLPVLLGFAAAAPFARADELATRVRAAELGRAYDDALFREAARSDLASTRRAAARAAARLKEPRAVAWLVPLVKDRAGPVRRTALFALGRIGGDDVALFLRQALSTLAQDDLPCALEALGKTRDARAVATIVSYLRAQDGSPAGRPGADAYVRGEAALALFRIDDVSALPELFGALGRETDAGARWRLVYSCWRLLRSQSRRAGGPVDGEPRWAELLRASCDATRPRHERIFAMRALGAVAGQRAFLLGRLDDEDPAVVVASVRATTRPWDAETAGTVAGRVRHADALVREAVVDHVVAGGADAVALLGDLAPRLAENPRLYARVQEALASHGRQIAFLPDALDADPAHREETRWRVLSYEPDRLPRDLPATTAGRMAAAEVCGEERVPKTRAVPVLHALLEIDDFVVRAIAIEALAKRSAKEEAPAIVKAARASTGTGRMDVRIEAAKALGALGDYDLWLDEAARDPDAPVREAAAEALTKLGRKPPPARPAGGFRLHGHDAAGVARAAEALEGARVVLRTNRGDLEMVLLPDEAPAHCVNLAALVEQGFYDGLTWHRVVANFVIQGGCPRGDGWGGPGYLLPDEIAVRATNRYVRGTVGMPRSGFDTGGCQIFVTHLPTPHLDDAYTIFAQVIRGLDVIDRIRVGDRITKATIHLRTP